MSNAALRSRITDLIARAENAEAAWKFQKERAEAAERELKEAIDYGVRGREGRMKERMRITELEKELADCRGTAQRQPRARRWQNPEGENVAHRYQAIGPSQPFTCRICGRDHEGSDR